jgi:ATP diphosphatase
MAKGMWEKIKAEEKAEKRSALARPRARSRRSTARAFWTACRSRCPALTRALKLQEKAARVGFDWSEAAPILDKIEEEIGELREAWPRATSLDQG